MTTDRVVQLILSALSLMLFAPALLSQLSYIETPLLIQIFLLLTSMFLLITAWVLKPRFREIFITELPWLFPDGK
jgi:hypothetical protein